MRDVQWLPLRDRLLRDVQWLPLLRPLRPRDATSRLCDVNWLSCNASMRRPAASGL
jgi:hypothetical protein